MDKTVTLHKGDGQRMVADAILGQPAQSNSIQRGQTVTIQLLNLNREDLTVESGDTYTVSAGDTEQYREVVVDGTLTVDGRLEADELAISGTVNGSGTVAVDEKYAAEIDDLRHHREFAGQFTVRETIDGTQKISETIDNSKLETLVVGIEPSQELQDQFIPGCWGVIETVSDERNAPLTNSRVRVDLRVLAPFSDYADVDAVTTDLRL